MTFLKTILKNAANTKNGARVFSHFIYLGFDEINLKCVEQLGSDWKTNPEKFSIALKQLLNYVVDYTSFLPSLTFSYLSNFELQLKDKTYRRWYFYFSDTAGPSVSEGINDVVKKIFNGQIGMISDNNIDVSESIIKVAQKIYIDCPYLKTIFEESSSNSKRSFAFESIFLLRIKYIGDKSRCTDSLFLNRNKYAECIQITGDENAYFTALMNGASTIFSPPSKFTMYFAPYFTYGNIESEGKFLLNLPIYKEILLKGESPTEFKITSSSSKKKSSNTDNIIPFKSLFITKGSLTSGDDVRNKSLSLIEFIESRLGRSYVIAVTQSKSFDEYKEIPDESKRKQKFKAVSNSFEGYLEDYETVQNDFNMLKTTVEDIFIPSIQSTDSSLVKSGFDYSTKYYTKIIEELRSVFVESNFVIEPVELTSDDFNLIKLWLN
jgi:hypothetical protein